MSFVVHNIMLLVQYRQLKKAGDGLYKIKSYSEQEKDLATLVLE